MAEIQLEDFRCFSIFEKLSCITDHCCMNSAVRYAKIIKAGKKSLIGTFKAK